MRNPEMGGQTLEKVEKEPRLQNYTVGHNGEVQPATWEVKDDLSPKELVDGACRVLRLSDDALYHELANRLEQRWQSPSDDAQPLIRAHIASILGIHRGIGKYDAKIDYTLLALAQGDKESRNYLEKQIPKWESKKKE